MSCHVMLERVLALCNPVESPPWPFAEALSPADVLDALSRNDLSADRVPHEAELAEHARRIAYFIRHGWPDAIHLDVGVPGLCAPAWPIEDGNHRLYAAAMRKDVAIQVEVSGAVQLAADLLGVPVSAI